MYKFEQTDFGMKLTLRGALNLAEMTRIREKLEFSVAHSEGPFSVLVDVSELIPPEREYTALLRDCQELGLNSGMQRMAIIHKSPVVKGQARQIAHLSGAAGIAKYIDASKVDNAEQIARDWLVDGIEPEPTENLPDHKNQAARS